jgi:hypothetical protein
LCARIFGFAAIRLSKRLCRSRRRQLLQPLRRQSVSAAGAVEKVKVRSDNDEGTMQVICAAA